MRLLNSSIHNHFNFPKLRGVDVPVKLSHASILMSKHAGCAKLALLLVIVEATVLLLKRVTICLHCRLSELTAIVSKFTILTISASGSVDPELAYLCLPSALCVRLKVSGEAEVAWRRGVSLGARGRGCDPSPVSPCLSFGLI